ncbi:Uncharacterized protein dnm_097700 [Desulfonema magnum]|uniref:Uncharacterized protein n=1 Tax=Desulfonema magnum TaxID=45655 RepID=A0A975BXJ9_9BACT|nr:Uncharacterized protein dnm_097700 [Desulfonema magnum]
MPPTRALPNGSGVQKFYFCACEKTFFALRIIYCALSPGRNAADPGSS